MSEEEKRSATDILLSVESKVSTLEKRLQNSENLLKILLGRLNAMLAFKPDVPSAPSVSPIVQESTLPKIPTVSNPNKIPFQATVSEPRVINKDNFENRPKTSKFAEAAAAHGIEVEDDPEPQRLPTQGKLVTPTDDEMVEAPGRAGSRGQRGPKNTTAKTSVSQIIRNEIDSPLFLANIEVFDTNGALINQTRTNMKGRWLLALAPGDYQVHVIKRYPSDSGKDPVDTTYPITVPPVDKPLELDPLNIGG